MNSKIKVKSMDLDNLENFTVTGVWEQEIVDAIGLEATLKLEEAFAGRYLYIPAENLKTEVVEAVGEESASALSEHFGCGDIWVPRGLLYKARNENIKSDRFMGKTVKELAVKFNLKGVRIREILRQRGINVSNKSQLCNSVR
jgi:Mor family transcriptional regulator